MKPFNLELAKKGYPVCTKDGRDARIICYDAKTGEYPIIALVYCTKSCTEAVYSYTLEGEYLVKEENNSDLMMKSARHTGWVNIYSGSGKHLFTGDIYSTKEDAIKGICNSDGVIDTVKIEWEE